MLQPMYAIDDARHDYQVPNNGISTAGGEQNQKQRCMLTTGGHDFGELVSFYSFIDSCLAGECRCAARQSSLHVGYHFFRIVKHG